MLPTNTESIQTLMNSNMVLVYFPTASPGSPYLFFEDVFIKSGALEKPLWIKTTAGSEDWHFTCKNEWVTCAI